jgi:hypothetical protein
MDGTHLETRHGHDLDDPDLQHLHDLSRKAPDPDETVGPLLRVRADQKQGGIVLGCPKGEGRRVLEGADDVGLGEGDGVRLLELVLHVVGYVRWEVTEVAGGRRDERAQRGRP